MIDEKTLNFFQKRKLKKYLDGKLTYEMYKNAPIYVQKNERVLRRIVNSYVTRLGLEEFKNEDIKAFIEKTFVEHKKIFDEYSIEQLIRYEISNDNYEFVKYLDDIEQEQLLSDSYYTEMRKNMMLKYFSESVIEKYIFSINDDFDKILNVINHINPQVQINIINKLINELDNQKISMILRYMNNEAQQLFLETHINELEKYVYLDYFNNEVISEILNKHKEFVLNHFDLLKKLSKENQLWIFEQNNKALEYLDEQLINELITKDSKLIDLTSINFKYSFFADKNNIELIKQCLNNNNSLYKYLNLQNNRKFALDYLKTIKPMSLNSDELSNLFIKSRLLSAKGNLRKTEFSYSRGYSEEITRGIDIYAESQIELIKKLSLEQITKLINIDVNYVLPYIHFNQTDDEYRKSNENAKNIFKLMFPNIDLDDYDEIIDLVFDMQKKEINKDSTTDFNMPFESLKLLFNKKVINSNPSLLLNKYYKNLFTEEDSSILFKEIIRNTYGEKAVKILEQRKELDVYAINSLEIFDSRILDNFSEEFVNDLISYNIRDFSTFLNIVKNDEDLNLFKNYYSLLTKIMGKSVEVMQKAITEFYYNKNLLKEISDKNLTEEQINSLFIILYSRNNKYEINTFEELNNFNDTLNSMVNIKLNEIEKLKPFQQADEIKNLILSYIFNIDRFDGGIIDYNNRIEKIDELFNFNYADRSNFTEKENFILNTIVKILHYEKNEDILKKLAIELLKDPFVKNPMIINNIINKARDNEMNIYKSKLVNNQILEENAIVKEYDGVKIYVLNGNDIFKNYYKIIAHSDINAAGRDFMEHESQASMSTVSAREYSTMEQLIRTKPHYLFNNIESEDIMAHSDKDANVTHNPKIIKSMSYGNISLKKSLSPAGEVAFYRRTKNHDKRNGNPNGRIKPSYICVVDDKESWYSIDDIPKEDLEYAKKYDIPILLIKSNCYKNKGGYFI